MTHELSPGPSDRPDFTDMQQPMVSLTPQLEVPSRDEAARLMRTSSNPHSFRSRIGRIIPMLRPAEQQHAPDAPEAAPNLPAIQPEEQAAATDGPIDGNVQDVVRSLFEGDGDTSFEPEPRNFEEMEEQAIRAATMLQGLVGKMLRQHGVDNIEPEGWAKAEGMVVETPAAPGADHGPLKALYEVSDNSGESGNFFDEVPRPPAGPSSTIRVTVEDITIDTRRVPGGGGSASMPDYVRGTWERSAEFFVDREWLRITTVESCYTPRRGYYPDPTLYADFGKTTQPGTVADVQRLMRFLGITGNELDQ
jgi:hypothetical protein